MTLVSIIGSSEKTGNPDKLVAPEFKSLKNGLVRTPSFSLGSFTSLKLLLKSVSCFLQDSKLLAFCFIVKYSSCNDDP
jgi:hypothetical protein